MKSACLQPVILALLCLASLNGCGPSQSNQSGLVSSPPVPQSEKSALPAFDLDSPIRTLPERHVIPLPAVEHENAIANAQIVCEKFDARSCPSGVGMLVSRSQNSLGQCTAFLISDTLAMTNSHCIPDDLKTDNSSCRERMQIFFPQSPGFPAEHASCEKILRVSLIEREGQPGFSLAPDYALLQLSRAVERQVLPISREGISENLTLSAISIDPQSRTRVEGRLKIKSCTARYGSIVAPSFTHAFAPVAAFSPCEIIPGNSGSPAIDGSGQVRAIVHATLPAKEQSSNGRLEKFRAMGLLTNLACTSLPASAGIFAAEPHPDCRNRKTQTDLVQEAYARADEKDLMPLAKAWLENAPKELKFQPQRSGNANSVLMVAPQIECVRDPKTSRLPRTATLSFSMPFWGFSIILDEDYRMQLQPGVLNEIAIKLEFDSAVLEKQGWVGARSTMKYKNSGESKTQESFVLKLCT